MKIYCIDAKDTFEIEAKKSGENAFVCPVCLNDRKKKSVKSASFNKSKGTGICHHCGVKYIEHKDISKLERSYTKPNDIENEISDKVVQWFAGRGISKETLEIGYVTESKVYIPQVQQERNAICFKYFRGSQLINIKYRDGDKNFRLEKDAELILYNLNSITGKDYAVICEGEIDCLSFIEAGISQVVSVPNGANLKSCNLDYIDNCYEELKDIKTFYIATDNDEAGENLRNELVRRLGSENCKLLDFEKYGCKDANEVLTKFDKETVSKLIDEARELPLEGIYDIQDDISGIYDLWESGMPKGKELMHKEMNDYITFVTSAVAIVTGIPSHGKSEFVDEICTQLNILHDWKIGYYSPENFPVRLHISKIVSKLSGKYFSKAEIDLNEVEDSLNYMYSNYFFIQPDDEDYSLDNVLEHARLLVKRRGIKVLVIDPWNKIDHNQESNETETQYISRMLDKIDRFSKKHDLLIFLVAHPRKLQKNKDGFFDVPTLYDVSGSAHFYNKAFYGLAVYRKPDFTEVHIQKVKFKHLGHDGVLTFAYDGKSGRYNEYDTRYSMAPDFNRTSYIKNKIEIV